MVKPTSPKDRRLHPRYLAYLPIEIRRKSAEGATPSQEVFNAFCIDISHGGVRFGTEEMFQLHELLELTLYSPDGGPELTCEVSVVRAARVPQHFEIAATILSVVPTETTVEASTSSKA